MRNATAIRLTIAAAVVAVSSVAHAGSKLEKVDMVAEGIDLKPAILRANSNGYTTYANTSHTYMLRLFAKAKGKSNAVYYAGIGSTHNKYLNFDEHAYQHMSGKSDGWGVSTRNRSTSRSNSTARNGSRRPAPPA